MLKPFTKLGMFVVLAVSACLAADETSAKPPISAERATAGFVYVATLQNGFSIRFDHRTQNSDESRLFLTADESSLPACTLILVPGGVCRTALDSRLSKI